ncbi:MAG: PEGA domain-containing protein [Polyangiaceae bacterium]|nr:PEGA domain-containing protein [Polyangiaceae bacterium]
MPTFARLAPVAALVATLAFADAAIAQSASESAPPSDADKARAMQKFEEGSRAFDQKRYKDAIDLFLEADLIIQNPAFAYNASLAYEAMGDVAAALRWAREYLYRSPKAEDRATVEASIRKYEVRLREKGVQQLTVRSTPSGATVHVDGSPLGVTPWTGELAPGDHVIELRRRGYADVTKEVELAADRAAQIELTLTERDESAKAGPAPVAGSAEVNEAPGWLLPLSITVIAAGAASGGAAIALEVLRGQEEDAARESATQVEAMDHVETMQDFQLGARIAAGVAGGLVLIGGTLLVVDFAAFDEAPPATAAATCGGSFCGLTLSGSF